MPSGRFPRYTVAVIRDGRLFRKSFWLPACLAAAALGALEAHAQVLRLRTTGPKHGKTSVIEAVELKGDLRLRHETLNKKSGGQAARQRQRFRFRLGSDLYLPKDFMVGFRLASGTGEHVSANQSFDSMSSQKGIWIDRAFLRWSPRLATEVRTRLSGGKMPNPLWRVYSSDAVYDKDLSPEGFGQSVELKLPDIGGAVFANAMQVAVDEDSSSEADQWLIAQQLGAELKLPAGSRLRVAGAYHHWSNERASSFGQVAINEGNRRAGGVLASEFDVLEVTGEMETRIVSSRLRVQGTYVNNVGVKASMAPRENEGRQVGAILGVKGAGGWEVAYFHKWLETDALPADFADSDFGDGGTNRRGHIVWGAYNVFDWLRVKAKFFYTKVISEGLQPGLDDINRLQVDAAVKF